MARPLSLNKAHQTGKDAARSDQFEWLARAGMAARGVIYAIIGVLALELAFGAGGKTTNQKGALKTIAEQSFGKALLVLMAVGLAGYAIWRLTRAVLGHGKETTDDGKARAESLVSGIAYGALCVAAVKIVAGAGGSSKSGEDKATGGILAWPGGTWIVMAGGVLIVAIGLQQGYKGVKRKFCDDTDTGRMSSTTRSVFHAVGLFGHLARMVIFGLIGVFLIKAALDYDPDKAVALDGALAKVANAPAGPVLLGLVAVGLLGFAAYSFMDARYRRV